MIRSVWARLKAVIRMGALLMHGFFFRQGVYRFCVQELWNGARLLCYGYGRREGQERIIGEDQEFIRVNIKGQEIAALKGVFKPGELFGLYQETFGMPPRNPHAYFCGPVAIVPGDVVIDAGACEGFFVKLALERSSDHVYAFEPVKSLYRGLSKSFEDDTRVSIIQAGLSDIEGRAKISTSAQYICEAKIDGNGDEEIDLVNLDAFVQKNGLAKLHFIKMDIEGAELGAIKGAQDVLRRFAPKLAIAVYHEYETAEKLKALILKINPDYQIEYGGCYMFAEPFRPFLLYGHGKVRS